DEVTRLAGSVTDFDAKVVVLTGLGSNEAPAQGSPVLDASSPGTISAEALRRAAGAATAKLSDISEITLALPTDRAAPLTAVAEAATIGIYTFVGYKTPEDHKTKTHDAVLKLLTTIAEADERPKRAGIGARAKFLTRDLVNTTPS